MPSLPPIAAVTAAATARRPAIRDILRGNGRARDPEPAGGDAVRAAVSGGGRPLTPAERGFFEPRLGRDLGRVRVHEDARADRAARSIRARAFTLGRDVAFRAGAYGAGSPAGRRLMAHELAHVIQQGRAPGTWVQRTPDETADEEAAALANASKDVDQAVQFFADNWAGVRKAGASFSELSGWIAHGDAVVGLIRAHARDGLAASKRGAAALYAANKLALQHDIVTYHYVAWHVVVYANLLGMQSRLKGLQGAFAADSRQFSGRADAEHAVAQLAAYAKAVPKHSKTYIGLVRADIALAVGSASLTVTSAMAPGVRSPMEKQTEIMRRFQISIQQSALTVNAFLDNAKLEGLAQAGQAVLELFEARGGKSRSPRLKAKKTPKSKSKAKADKSKSEDKSKDKGEKKERGRGRHTCFGRSFVLQIPSALPEHKCPDEITQNRQDGPAVSAASQDAACRAAKHAFNARMPRGCRPKHLQCVCTRR